MSETWDDWMARLRRDSRQRAYASLRDMSPAYRSMYLKAATRERIRASLSEAAHRRLVLMRATANPRGPLA